MNDFLDGLIYVKKAKTQRISSWDISGRNEDCWKIEKGERRILADIQGPGKITHIWMTQESADPYILRKVTIGVYWDNEANPSVLVPLGDFFCLGHSMINSFQSIFFTASTNQKAGFGGHVALNCYLPMPFNKSARIELHNESSTEYWQYCYIDYQVYEQEFSDDTAYFHASFNRENPTAGWGHEITVNTPPGQYCQFN